MDLEELTKSQIVLLTLLISFVTSMATGIVTVSLAEQGVSPVTNTVNKIVERTKEIVVKVEEPTDPVVIKEQVLVTEKDQVAAAIAKNKDTAVAIYKSVEVEITAQEPQEPNTDTTVQVESDTQLAAPIVATDSQDTANNSDAADEPAPTTEMQLVFVARGLVIGEGIVATDASMLDDSIEEYTIITNNKEHIPATLTAQEGGIALLAAELDTPAQLVSVDTLEHGQVVVVLSGTDRMRVTKTIIAEILTRGGEVVAVDTNASNISPGSALISLDGSVVGISTGASRKDGKAWFTTANKIEAALSVTMADSAEI